jgi:hypothetical protein
MADLSIQEYVAHKRAARKGVAVVEAPVPKEEPPLFQTVFITKRRSWRGLALSLCLHCFCIFVVIPFSYWLSDSEEAAWRQQARLLRPLEVTIPDRLYFSGYEPPPKPPEELPAKPKVPPTKEAAKTEQALPAPAPRPNKIIPRQFKLSDLPRNPNSDQTLVQLHLPPDLPLVAQQKLPTLLLTAPLLPAPPPKTFIRPGRSALPAVAPKVDAPPELATPSEANQDIQIANMLAGPEEALLRLPRPSLEARVFRPPAAGGSGRGASVSPSLGEPINILSVSSNPAALHDRITIPLGNQVGNLRLPPPPADATGPLGIPSPTAGNAVRITGSEGDGEGDTGAGHPGGTGGTKQGQGFEIAMNSPSVSVDYSTPIRIEHPANEVFDIVVVQSSVEEGFPESAGALSGQPIYTVYLKVGAPRAWLLQYCLPKGTGKGPTVVGNTVYIGRETPIKAPFPLVTVLPPVTMQARTAYIMVHGFVDKAGQFKDLTVLHAPDDQVKKLLLPQLAEWQFRPATRDGVPVLVEILLAIPPQAG